MWLSFYTAFAIGPGEFADDIRACQQESGTFCNGTLYGVPCRILFNTNTLASGSSTNVVDTYQTKASGYSPETDFENVAACAKNTMNHYLDIGKDILKDTQFEFKSVEGDFFHQFIDCILLGPYRSRLFRLTLRAFWKAWCTRVTKTPLHATLNPPVRKNALQRRRCDF